MIPFRAAFLSSVYSAGGASDPDFSSVSFLSGFEGTDGSTSFIDESAYAHTLTAHGNCQIDTAIKKFGDSAALFDGTGDYISAPDHAGFNFGSSDFTIEGFFYFSTVSNVRRYLASKWGSSGNWGWYFLWHGQANPDTLTFLYSTTGSNAITPLSDAWTPTAATCYHLCVDRSGSTMRSYVDGVMLGKNTGGGGTIYATTTELQIGAREAGDCFTGSIDEMRITKGVARYASDSGFTVPTEAYPRS